MKSRYLLFAPLMLMLLPTTINAEQKSGLTEEVCRPFATKRYDDYVRKTKGEGQFKVGPQTPTWEKHRALMIQFRIEKCLREGMWEDEIDTTAASIYAEAQSTGKPYRLCGTVAAGDCPPPFGPSGLIEALCRSFAENASDSYSKRKALKLTVEDRADSIENRTKFCLRDGIWFNDIPPIGRP
jgi:hypothetical protein